MSNAQLAHSTAYPPFSYDPYAAASYVQAQRPGFIPRIGIVLGSGLGLLAEQLVDPLVISYADIPNFPVPSVAGHAGKLILGELAGIKVACFQGRTHMYEGKPNSAVATPMRVLKLLGAEIAIVTSAVGGLRPDLGPGTLILVEDHINMLGSNPLVGANDDRFGPRFPDLGDAWNKELRHLLRQAAAKINLKIGAGIFANMLGPAFETPAEIRMLQKLGVDAVSMSGIPDCLVAHHAGLKVLGCLAVVNYGAGMSDEQLSHEHTIKMANQAAGDLARLLTAFAGELSHG